MAVSLYSAQTPTQTDSATGRRTIGNVFSISSSGYSTTRGRVWVMSGGLPATTGLWQLWNADTQTKLAEVDFKAALGSPTTNAWSPYFTVPSVALSTGVNYYVGQHIEGSPGYSFTDGVPATFPFGNSPLQSSNTGNFQNGGDSNTWASSTYAAYFFADVEVDLTGQSINVGLASERDSTFAMGLTAAVSIALSQAVEKDSTFSVGNSLAVAIAVGQALERDSARSMGHTGGQVGAEGAGLSATYLANVLAGSLVQGAPSLSMKAAILVWLGKNPDLEVVQALNERATNTLPNWRAIAGVLNQIAGTTDLEPPGSLDAL